MKLDNVIADLERTISIKEMHLATNMKSLHIVGSVEYIVHKATNEYLAMNIAELKRIVADLHKVK